MARLAPPLSRVPAPAGAARALRRVSARAARAARSLALACSALAACVGAPDAERLLAVGWRTPEQAFETFKTAIAADQPHLEYRCFSAGFRRANGLSENVYREARARLLEEQPFIRWFSKAEIERSESRGERVQYLEVVVDAKVAARRFGVVLVRDDAIEIYSGDPEHRGELVFDAYVEFGELVRVETHDDGSYELRVRERFYPNGALDGARLGEVRVLQEWKIDELLELDDEGRPKSPPAT